MKARLCLVASLLLMAAPAFAQEPLEKTGTEPSAQTPPAASDAAPANEPLEKAGTEPSAQATPAAGDTAPANEPLEKAGTEPSQSSEPAAAPSQEAAAPAEVVVTEFSEVDDSKKMVQPWGLPADTVEEMDVYDANGRKIGQVDVVLQNKNGEIKGVAVGYGGFLGFGEKGAIVTIDQLKLKDGTLITEFSEDQLSQQPQWMKK